MGSKGLPSVSIQRLLFTLPMSTSESLLHTELYANGRAEIKTEEEEDGGGGGGNFDDNIELTGTKLKANYLNDPIDDNTSYSTSPCYSSDSESSCVNSKQSQPNCYPSQKRKRRGHDQTHILKKFKCSTCKKLLGSAEKLKIHIGYYHHLTKCEFCEKRFVGRRGLYDLTQKDSIVQHVKKGF